MAKASAPNLHEIASAHERLEQLDIKLRVLAMAVKGVAKDSSDEDAYAISNMIMDICEQIQPIKEQMNSFRSEAIVTKLDAKRITE